MTLTHGCNTPWADAAQVEDGDFPPRSNGLSPFGVKIVEEMNRLGMMVDLAHVSSATMQDALEHSLAPVIFSHSSARAVSRHARNVPDHVLRTLKQNRGLVMVNLYTCFLVDDCNQQNATKLDVVRHINHIRRVAGVDHVGLGGDYNGINQPPVDLPDVAFYPRLLQALVESKEIEWSDEDLGKLTSGNLIRVFREAEEIRDEIQGREADNDWIPAGDLVSSDAGCMSEY